MSFVVYFLKIHVYIKENGDTILYIGFAQAS